MISTDTQVTGPASLPSRISLNGKVELLSIPGGSFQMGSPEGVGSNSEHPQHRVTIKPFWLGRYPVTNEQYRSYLQAHPKVKEPGLWGGRRFNQDQQPVVGVTWENAQQFCVWAGGRLPTEAEWEYACRAGTVSAFHWGDEEVKAVEYTWFGEDWQNGSTHAVGEKRPNPWGLYDMAGNVWEWTQDNWHDNYDGAPEDGSAWESGGSADRGVIRGGSWDSKPEGLRLASRGWNYRGYGFTLGFRLLQDI